MAQYHETLLKFGAPETIIQSYDHWAVCLRPKQVTLGSLVMISLSEHTNVSQLGPPAFQEMHRVITDIENALGIFVSYEKINYMTLMMVDPQVHSHVIPRYNGIREFDGVKFEDSSWPGPPDLSKTVDCQTDSFNKLYAELKKLWP